MAKSKTKKHKKRNPKPAVAIEPKISLYQKDKHGTVFAWDTPCMPCASNMGEKSETMTVLPVKPLIQKTFCDELKNTNNRADTLSQIKHDIGLTQKLIDNYFSRIKDFDHMLNIYGTKERYGESVAQSYDTIDFREFIAKNCPADNDFIKQSTDIINDPDFEYDISWLWSTNKYMSMQITPSLRYRIIRLGIDYDEQNITYGCVAYKKFNVTDDCSIEVPSNILVFRAQCCEIDLENKKYLIAGIPSDCPQSNNVGLKMLMDQYVYGTKENEMSNIMLDGYTHAYGKKFRFIKLNICAHITSFEIVKWIRDNAKYMGKLMPTSEVVIAYNTLWTTYYDVHKDINTVAGIVKHIEATASASNIVAALIHMNKRLKARKLSRPLSPNNAYMITHKKEIILENKPERQTRTLGDDIFISSDSKPDTPTKEKIIKFYVPEWHRREHLRHLKSGKIVTVKSATCKRQCVDMSDVTNKQKSTGVDYKVKNKERKNANDT